MGSKCSIFNDTQHDVWITHGVNWEVVITVVGGLFVVLQAGATIGTLIAPKGEGFLHYAGKKNGALQNKEGMTCLTKGDWANVATLLGATDEAVANVLRTSQARAHEIKNEVKKFQESSEKISPGEKYTFSGSLSLTMRVYVMNEKLQVHDRGCFTGPTAESENIYLISKHFTNLDID
ncbi:uncharacterized protein LOC114528451 [Dendronephthya gigantea]|uniref:uncharacterized protein LOC114528451 n=1 Tax=Dendronephthya gigantea TaxID=151771 RepID=UPI00106C1A4A|nr:uncharacterized protein LOC114528451 [Dendronephthya gigantea]